MRVSNRTYGGIMTFGLVTLGLLTYTQSAGGVQAATSAEGLGIEVTHKPTPCYIKSQKGDQLSMHYDGSLASNGQQFDSSRKRGRPFEFKVGAGQVIKGWDLGLLDMCPGEKRTLTIPADLGYGSRGAGGLIPGGATLIFETELLEIKNRKAGKDEL